MTMQPRQRYIEICTLAKRIEDSGNAAVPSQQEHHKRQGRWEDERTPTQLWSKGMGCMSHVEAMVWHYVMKMPIR